jgi:replication factor C small subunit
MSQIWIEKHRPKSFEDIKGHDKIVSRVKAFVEQKNLPHILLAGPAGVGKTSLILVVAKALYGESWRENVLDLNASDDRGIDVIRNQVKDFARTMTIGNVPFKTIILDEADALTRDAQQSLRRIMENYASTTRFCLICNYSSKIIDPIQSRCAVFRFKPLEDKDIELIIKKIAKEEEIKIDDKAVKSLIEIGEGDVRRVENIMQSCAATSKSVSEDLVYEIVSAARPKEINEVLKLAINGNFIKARDLLLEVMLKHGLSGLDVVKQIQKEIWKLDIKDENKIMLIDKCGEIEFRMVEGSDEFLQIESLLANFVRK